MRKQTVGDALLTNLTPTITVKQNLDSNVSGFDKPTEVTAASPKVLVFLTNLVQISDLQNRR